MRIALITGVTGQDGSYMAEDLLNDDRYTFVYGLVRRSSTDNCSRIRNLENNTRFIAKHGDITDITCISGILKEIWSNQDISRLEVYNLAAMSHVGVSFKVPLYTFEVDALGVLNILEAIRNSGHSEMTRFYQASTSELYGKVTEIPQTETTPFYPRSPYGVAKLCGYWITVNYRESYGMFACNGILFNHESPRRGENFVTKKITKSASLIKKSLEAEVDPPILKLGNLEAKRDWGYAPDYVRGMRDILDQEEPDDYVLATGETHSVREFVEVVFKLLGLPLKWEGSGLKERGLIGDVIVIEIDEKFFRPAEVNFLLGDATKAKKILGWEPKVKFEDMVRGMLDNF